MKWWIEQGLWFNLVLLGSGVIAFGLSISTLLVLEKLLPDVDVNLVSFAVDAAAFLAFVLFSNLGFALAAAIDLVLRSNHRPAYRRRASQMATLVAIAPFLAPLLLLAEALWNAL